MDKRRKNMQLYNALRSARVEGMIDMINTIDYGCSELDVLGVYDGYRLERQINSYRAMKIAQYFGVNVSKGKLTRFSKPKKKKKRHHNNAHHFRWPTPRQEV